MPALPDVPKVIKIVLHQHIGADNIALNRIFFRYDGTAPSDTQLATLAGAISTDWQGNIAPLVDTACSLQQVECTDLSSPTAAHGVDNTIHAGTRAGSGLPSAVCAVVKQNIARRYRGGHPRVYLRAGVLSDMSGESAWAGAFVTEYVNDYNAFSVALQALGWAGASNFYPVNVSYYQGFHNFTFPSGRVRALPTLRGAPVVDPITSYAGNPRPANQRRRSLQGD